MKEGVWKKKMNRYGTLIQTRERNAGLSKMRFKRKDKLDLSLWSVKWSSHVQAKESDCGGDELYGVYNPSAYRNIYS